MPFTLTQLQAEMSPAMVGSAMLTQQQLAGLMNAPNVDQAVNALGVINQWNAYWNDLDQRIQNFGGDITQPSATAQFGLQPPPQNMGLRVILNDCFDDTWRWMQNPNFRPQQALANHIRLLRQ